MPRTLVCGPVLLIGSSAYAAPPTSTAPGASAAQERTSHIGDTADHARIAVVDRSSADKATVVVTIDPGYHINANPASFKYLIPTTLNVTAPPPLHVTYPGPVRFKPMFVNDVLDVYEGTIRIVVEFSVGSLPRAQRLSGTLTAQACTDKICLPPADLVLPAK